MPPRSPESGPLVGRHVGDHEIVSLHARGGLSEVYLAHHAGTGRPAAVKIVDAALCSDAERMARFERDARAARAVRHPALVELLAVGRLDDGRAFVVTPWLQGRPLPSWLKEQEPVDVARSVELLLPLLEGLAALHAAGVVHQDLRPSNVFLVDGPGAARHPLLLDAGLAALRPAVGQEGITSPPRRLEARFPYYAAPEQVAGVLRDVGPWTDVYSVGALLFLVLAGRPPFVGDSISAVAQQVIEAPAPRLSTLRPDVSPALEQVIARALSKRPIDRYPGPSDLAAALIAALAPVPVPVPVPVPDPGPSVLVPLPVPDPVPSVPDPVPSVPLPLPLPLPAPVPLPLPAPTPSPRQGWPEPPRDPRAVFTLVILGLLLVIGLVVGITLALQQTGDGEADDDDRPARSRPVHDGAIPGPTLE